MSAIFYPFINGLVPSSIDGKAKVRVNVAQDFSVIASFNISPTPHLFYLFLGNRILLRGMRPSPITAFWDFGNSKPA